MMSKSLGEGLDPSSPKVRKAQTTSSRLSRYFTSERVGMYGGIIETRTETGQNSLGGLVNQIRSVFFIHISLILFLSYLVPVSFHQHPLYPTPWEVRPDQTG